MNGTWLDEPLHVVLTDVPIGAWTIAMIFDALDLIRGRNEFGPAADTSIGIGLVGVLGAAKKDKQKSIEVFGPTGDDVHRFYGRASADGLHRLMQVARLRAMALVHEDEDVVLSVEPRR